MAAPISPETISATNPRKVLLKNQHTIHPQAYLFSYACRVQCHSLRPIFSSSLGLFSISNALFMDTDQIGFVFTSTKNTHISFSSHL